MSGVPIKWLLPGCLSLLAAAALLLRPAEHDPSSGPLERERDPGAPRSPGTGSGECAPALEANGRRAEGVQEVVPEASGRLIVRDAFTGQRIPGIGLCIRLPDQAVRSALASESGEVDLLPGEMSAAVVPSVVGWSLAVDQSGATGERTVWLYRVVAIRGRVVLADGEQADLPSSTTPSDITVRVLAPVPASGPLGPSRAVGSHSWMRERGLDVVREEIRVDKSWQFSAQIPRLAGYFVTASAAFRSTAQHMLSFDADTDVVEGIELRLGVPLAYTGRVRDAHGQPLSGAQVRCEWVLHGTEEALKPLFASAQLRGLGTGLICSKLTGDCELYIHARLQADEAGLFRTEIPDPGMSLAVEVLHSGHRPERASVRDAGASGARAELVLQRPDGETPRCQLCSDGAPMVGHHVMFSLIDVPRSFGMDLGPTDSRGRFPAEWLEAGRKYAVYLTSATREKSTYFMRWANHMQIDTKELAVRREDVR